MLLTSKEQLSGLSEMTLRKDVIMPLLRKMSYLGVTEDHGALEFGKDIVAYKVNEFDSVENLAVVAKASRIIGEEAKEVGRQIRQAWKDKFRVGGDNTERSATRILVITNKAIPKEGREKIISEIEDEMERGTDFIDCDRLWDLWCKHFPVGMVEFAQKVQKGIHRFPPKLDPLVSIDKDSISVAIRPSDDALTVDERTFRTKFKFPDTDEGREMLRALEASRETGSPIKVPGKYFELELPAFMRQMSEQIHGASPSEFTSIEITSPIDDRPWPVRIEIASDDGDHAALPYVDLRVRQAGSRELTLSNSRQQIPVHITLVLDSDRLSGNFNFTIVEGPMTAKWLLRWYEILRCMAKPGEVVGTLLEENVRLFRSRNDGLELNEVDEETLNLIRDLARIEEMLGQQIYVPDGDLSEEERQVIHKLRSLLRKPKFEVPWGSGLTVTIDRDGYETSIDDMLDGKNFPFLIEGNETATLASHEFSLGRVRRMARSAKLGNIEELNEQLARGETILKMVLFPAENDILDIDYLDWVHEPAEPGQGTEIADTE